MEIYIHNLPSLERNGHSKWSILLNVCISEKLSYEQISNMLLAAYVSIGFLKPIDTSRKISPENYFYDFLAISSDEKMPQKIFAANFDLLANWNQAHELYLVREGLISFSEDRSEIQILPKLMEVFSKTQDAFKKAYGS